MSSNVRNWEPPKRCYSSIDLYPNGTNVTFEPGYDDLGTRMG